MGGEWGEAGQRRQPALRDKGRYDDDEPYDAAALPEPLPPPEPTAPPAPEPEWIRAERYRDYAGLLLLALMVAAFGWWVVTGK